MNVTDREAAARMLDATSTPIKETRTMPNFLTESELNTVKGLLHYLNENMIAGAAATVEARLIDSNGDSLGTIKTDVDGSGAYVLEFPA